MRSSRVSTAILILGMLLSLPVSGGSKTPVGSFDPNAPERMDLGKGDHVISPHFVYQVESGGRPHLLFFHVSAGGTEKRELLGALLIDKVVIKPQSRQSAFALSPDGNTLLYMNEGDRFCPEGKPRGLYEYVEGSGDRTVHAGASKSSSIFTLPADALEFVHPTEKERDGSSGEHFVRTTAGEEYPANVHGGSDLHRAAYGGRIDDVRRLMEGGADLAARDQRGYTALHEAIWQFHLDVARALVDAGADANAVSASDILSQHWTPFYMSVYFNPANALVDDLIAHGANVNIPDDSGWTPLHVVAAHDNLEMARKLLEYGADIGARDHQGATPLQLARTEAMRQLLMAH